MQGKVVMSEGDIKSALKEYVERKFGVKVTGTFVYHSSTGANASVYYNLEEKSDK